MTRLASLLLLGVVIWPSVAGADSGRPTNYVDPDIDKFLREQVQPEIEAGDEFSGNNYKKKVEIRLLAITRYLKALVLIEKERLRRENR